MWVKSGTWTGLNTDAWLFNYGVGIGSTQVPFGVRLAALQISILVELQLLIRLMLINYLQMV